MTDSTHIECTARTLKALAHPLRLKVLCTLHDREMSVKEIVASSGATQSNISQHLNHLREEGILASRRDANRVYYRIAKVELIDLIKMMQSIYCSNEAA